MAISNKRGQLVLTTGNKSEMAVGYATLYGDMAGGFAPLKDVAKTTVYQLAQYRNQQAGYPLIPQRVIERPASAELAPGRWIRIACRPTVNSMLFCNTLLKRIVRLMTSSPRGLSVQWSSG